MHIEGKAKDWQSLTGPHSPEACIPMVEEKDLNLNCRSFGGMFIETNELHRCVVPHSLNRESEQAVWCQSSTAGELGGGEGFQRPTFMRGRGGCRKRARPLEGGTGLGCWKEIEMMQQPASCLLNCSSPILWTLVWVQEEGWAVGKARII